MITLLQRADIEEAVRLSAAVGWNQTEQDWLRLLELNPSGCFVLRCNDRIVGSAGLAALGPRLAWVGMVIVDPGFQGQGLGKRLFAHTLEEARKKGIERVGLDATEPGSRLYRRYGFHEVQGIDRWAGRLKVAEFPGQVQALDAPLLRQAMELDRQCSGCDRGPLLRRLHEEKQNQAFAFLEDRRLKGFVFVRPGRQYRHVGPLLADSKESFAGLMDAAAGVLEGELVIVDALRREETTMVLKERGLEIQRELTRMTWGAPQAVLNDPRLRLAVALEWG